MIFFSKLIDFEIVTYLQLNITEILGDGTVRGKKRTPRFSTVHHGSARARTAVQFKSDNASAILFVINNT